VGGGLGVDYAGTRSNSEGSMNYSPKEYATHILLAVRGVCQDTDLPEPHIISESGRALTAHHAILITNITDAEIVKSNPIMPTIEANESQVIHDILDTYQAMSHNSATEIYNYAEHERNEANDMFKHGVISLTDKAKVEQLYTAICLELQHRLDPNNPGDNELIEILNQRFAAKLFCNLSFFQSIPDAWAIEQIFPIAPISQLNNPPMMCSILQDLTCDSDGTLKQYTDTASVHSTLQLPAYDPKTPYHLAFFLVGAYQEILGNLHNLFGDTNSLDVKLLDNGEFEINDLVSGDTITNVLNYAHYDTKKLLQSYEKQLLNTELTNTQINDYLNEFRSIFSQLTYLNSEQ
jgi:arginine decarboxylase